MLFQAENTGWLSTLVALTVTVYLSANDRAMEPFMENWFGPVSEFRPASPHWPAGGAAYAAAFRNRPAAAA